MGKKILILANSVWGLHDFRRELIAELSKYNDVTAATPFDEPQKVENLKRQGCRLIEQKMERRGMNPVKDLGLMLQYFRLLKREKPDIVITYTIKPGIYGGAVCRLVRQAYAVNITGLGTAFEGQGFLRRLVTAMYRFSLRSAKVVFFENSENMQLFIDEKIIRADQAKLLNGAGVNLEKFALQPYPEDRDETRFLFMGRIMAEKGVDELFAAMRLLRAEGINCTLDMLGGFDEDYGAKIKAAEAEGWLRYHGYQSDVRPFIRNCHCFVLPSWHEGMANTNLECAASGRPVITTRIHGCMEAVEENVTGYLCEKQNAESLFQSMKRFAELPITRKRDMGQEGRKRMQEIFDKQKVINETINGLSIGVK